MRAFRNQPTNSAALLSSEEELLADVDEPPDLERTPRPSGLKILQSFEASFSKSRPAASERKESLLTCALHSDSNSPTDEHMEHSQLRRGFSSASTWSSHSASTAELTSDGGLTSPGTRANTPSPPFPSATFHNMAPMFSNKPLDQSVSVVRHDDEHIVSLQKQLATKSDSSEHDVEATLGRKRCITFACGKKDAPKPTATPTPNPATEAPKPEPPKRKCTIKFACPTKISTDTQCNEQKPRMSRNFSPPPPARRERVPSKGPKKAHRDSNSTVRNASPVSTKKSPAARNRTRRLSANSDLAHTEAFRFHEFASSEEEVEEWTQESTCHRSRLTITDTLRIENTLRQLGQEVEEEALDDEEDLDDDDEDDVDFDDDDDLDDDDEEEDVSSDEGFQTDDEEGFAVSDDDSDAGSDFNWWAPGASTAATSVEHLEQIRPSARRTVSESSNGSDDSDEGFKMPPKPSRRKKSRPVNIRVPSPELPDSTDFVCGTLDEDRPLEAAYMSCLERRRAAKHRITPQDIDPTFPQSDPDMDEEDEDDEPDNIVSESDQYAMIHGSMDHLDGDPRGRKPNGPARRPASPRRLRSPPPTKRAIHRSPPPTKRAVHRSPPPRKLFGTSPRRARSPAPGVRLRSPPPTRRGSAIMTPNRQPMHINLGGLAERPVPFMASSVPRTPMSVLPPDDDLDGDETCREMPVRRAIDIKIGLENKRLRRKEQLYKKLHRKGVKDKEKRPAPGKGCERMREMGRGLAALRGKTTAGVGFGMGMPPTPDQKDMHVLSI
ncbi:hypothetical protein BU24DRAFT_339039 [Aaosphaeria arxii CBS 175.79]|uniref:Uncharacterized protein n=1 Tax=Aaosphaeria arxii CBS 175.79 TaxID=1450172 RepID=A0A6A5YAY9_9PLEO|nr:uncharacterized protein BU24DRAFT_339039 [Aaosphaeria arxii CBS 175.79]KAF2021940.1 hypothetical protein BU24DRAFT_339039 [Aaosphaeria arxii CBS 175.79]